MKKYILLCLFGVSLLTACSGASKPANLPAAAPVTTLTGTLIKTGKDFWIQIPGQASAQVDSYTVKFDAYVGQKITVSGQYSGTTLFADTVSVNK